MEGYVVLGVTIALVVVFFWFDWRSTRMADEYAEALKRHPAGGRCVACNTEVEDWDTHVRLAHAVRVTAPDDML